MLTYYTLCKSKYMIGQVMGYEHVKGTETDFYSNFICHLHKVTQSYSVFSCDVGTTARV